jgi:hypothetical protein
MKTIRPFYFILLICGLFLLTSCIVKDSPAPGCVEYLLIAPMGGCSGKTILTDLELEGFPECAKVTVKYCNGGVLEVQNECSEALSVSNFEVAPGESVSLDVQPAEDGGFELVSIPSNFSDYSPSEDQFIEIIGTIGDQALTISLTKTAPLCK